MVERVDAIVIGAGQSGPSLATRLAAEGRKTVLIERDHLGGTCVNDGCTPTKTLIASARVAHVARRAAEYGVVLGGGVSVDMKAVKARKDAVVQASIDGLTGWIGGTDNLELVWGEGRFTGPKTVTVGERSFEAENIFINTGGRAVVPDWPGLGEVPYLTNTSMMDIDTLPEHLVIVGGSYVGLEFAQMYRRFGSQVTVVAQGDRLVSREDHDVSQAIREILEAEGIAFVFDAGNYAVKAQGTGFELSLTSGGAPKLVAGSHLLLAIGRVPNTDRLNLGAAGIETDRHGYITVDDQLRTNVPGIWATGDVNGKGAFTHTSWNDYEIVAANMFDNDPRRVSDRVTAYALYIDPPLARIGQTETEVRASGRKALIATMSMARISRAKERGETQGFLKALVDAETGMILGASLLGIEADEVVHGLLDMMTAKQPASAIARTMHIHPTVSELIPTLLQGLKPVS